MSKSVSHTIEGLHVGACRMGLSPCMHPRYSRICAQTYGLFCQRSKATLSIAWASIDVTKCHSLSHASLTLGTLSAQPQPSKDGSYGGLVSHKSNDDCQLMWDIGNNSQVVNHEFDLAAMNLWLMVSRVQQFMQQSTLNDIHLICFTSVKEIEVICQLRRLVLPREAQLTEIDIGLNGPAHYAHHKDTQRIKR